MKNLYTAKNPFLSLWLSAANSALGASQGLWMAEMQRQQQAFVQAWTEAVMHAWMPWLNSSRRDRR